MEKSKADLAWDDIRVAVQYVANLRASRAKARALNRILPDLQNQFETALQRGTLLELGPNHMREIEAVLAEELDGALGR